MRCHQVKRPPTKHRGKQQFLFRKLPGKALKYETTRTGAECPGSQLNDIAPLPRHFSIRQKTGRSDRKGPDRPALSMRLLPLAALRDHSRAHEIINKRWQNNDLKSDAGQRRDKACGDPRGKRIAPCLEKQRLRHTRNDPPEQHRRKEREIQIEVDPPGVNTAQHQTGHKPVDRALDHHAGQHGSGRHHRKYA